MCVEQNLAEPQNKQDVLASQMLIFQLLQRLQCEANKIKPIQLEHQPQAI